MTTDKELFAEGESPNLLETEGKKKKMKDPTEEMDPSMEKFEEEKE